MSVESLPNPGDPAIPGTVSNEQNKTGDPDWTGGLNCGRSPLRVRQ